MLMAIRLNQSLHFWTKGLVIQTPKEHIAESDKLISKGRVPQSLHSLDDDVNDPEIAQMYRDDGVSLLLQH